MGDVLRAARVPFAYFKQEKLFQTIEAREVLDLLRAIADPDDDTARARAFITPFFGLGLVDLAACDDLDASHAAAAPAVRLARAGRERATSRPCSPASSTTAASSAASCSSGTASAR